MSRFVVAAGSHLVANARSSLHALTYRAPLSGHVDASMTGSGFDLAAPVTAAFEVELDELKGDDPRTDSEMRRRVDVHRYPRAWATVNGVTAIGEDRYRLAGELTVRDQTRPFEGEAAVTLDGPTLIASGSVTIDIRDFGIKAPKLLLLKVHPEVEIVLDLRATVDDG